MPNDLAADKFLLDQDAVPINLGGVKIGSPMMSVFQILLGLHVLGGSVALLVGPIPMLARKGGSLHRKAGLVFCIALGCGSVSAFVLAIAVHNDLLLTIAVLTAFLILSGMRAVRFKRGANPSWMDEVAHLSLACFGGWLLWRSVSPLDVTGLFFGVGSLALAGRQWQLQHTSRPDWLLAHIAGMGGAYLATVTAFLVVNFSFLPKPITFIVPTVIGTVFITWASIHHAARPNRQVVTV